ncbi:transcription elongation factor SPT4 homolog [Striga asiatica]|uniref:Transcription elongation factor SPT4 homolog n=1 Tax=Striga asiatica TaxID=4170 RepID=A0A5A7PAM9_STRAF|nr:transcription elongation factor SPT4 homolog [Striga asiatica]
MTNQGVVIAQIPTGFGHELRACLRCRLVKTYDQFRASGCENCPFFQMEDDHDRVVDCTTTNISGVISVMNPARSWASKWLRTEAKICSNLASDSIKVSMLNLICLQTNSRTNAGKFVPGCYTLGVSEVLPQDLQNICEEEGVLYAPPKCV